MKKIFWSIAMIAALLALPQTASAYLDPGTGSMLLQGLIALVGGVMTAIGLYWRTVKGFLHRMRHRKSDGKSGSERD